MEFFNHLSYPIQIIILGFFGLATGSFISLVSMRLVNKKPIILARSQCQICHKNLPFYVMIPLFSWLIQRGKSLCCKQPISYRYPLIETICALVFVSTFYVFGNVINSKYLIYLAIFVVIFLMVIIDIEHYFIPDILQYFLAFFTMILFLNNGGVSSSISALKPSFIYLGFGATIWLFFYFSSGVDAIGIDDFKFFFVVGFLLGLDNFILFMFVSGLVGSIFGFLWQKIKNDETFPFAPAICFATYFCMLFGKNVSY